MIIDNCGEVKAINKCVLLPLKGPYQRQDGEDGDGEDFHQE